MAVVYRHRRADTGEVFYVGAGGKKRPGSFSKRGKGWRAVQKEARGVDVEVLTGDIDRELALELEELLIEEYGRKCNNTGPLVNLTAGGPSLTGYKHTKATKEKLRKAHTGRVIPESSRVKMGIPVFQFDISGNYIQEFPTGEHAAKYVNRDKADIAKASTGKNHTCGGFIWARTKEEGPEKAFDYRSKQKVIEQYTIEGDLVGVFETAKEAAESAGISYQLVCNVCKDKSRKTGGGFIWKYKNKYDE